MNKDHVDMARALMKATCFRLARVTLIIAVAVLATEGLFPTKDRSWAVMGPSVWLLVSSVFAMALCWPRRRS